MQGLLTALALTLGALLSTLTGASARSLAVPPSAAPTAGSAAAVTAPPSVAPTAAASSVPGGQLRAYMVRLVDSIVASYDVDGINLDGIRYPDDNLGTNVPSWGYDPTALARFRAETGRTDTPAPTDPQWTQWRRDRVTDFVRRVYVDGTALRPGIRLSADTIAYGYGPQSQGGWANTRTYAELLQDWVGWMREGILDLNIPMDYKRDGDAGQRQQYLEWNEFAKEQQYGRQAAIGSALYLNDAAASVRQIRTALAPGAVSGRSAIGWAGYSYRARSVQRGLWKLVSRVFPENTASLGLLRAVGFREVGVYRRHAKLDGAWRDVVIVERLVGEGERG